MRRDFAPTSRLIKIANPRIELRNQKTGILECSSNGMLERRLLLHAGFPDFIIPFQRLYRRRRRTINWTLVQQKITASGGKYLSSAQWESGARLVPF
jgi:hypothetical protein